MCFLPFCCRALTGLLFVGALLSLVDLVEAAPFTPVQNRVEVIVASGFDPVPIDVGLVPDAEGFDFTAMKAVSDRAWVVPTVQGGQGAGHLQLVFVGAADLVTSNTATVTLTHGSEVRSVFVQALVSPLSLATLLDDPGRSRMYGLHRPGPGLKRGSVVALDPLSGQPLGSQSLGRRPTDLALSADGNELLVLNAADKSVTVMEAATLRVKEMIALPAYDDWDPAVTAGDLVAGAGSLLYYTDGAWAPVLRVFDRATGTVVQTVTMPPADFNFGFGDFAFSPDRTRLYAWGQLGWTAGSDSSYTATLVVDAAGRISSLQTAPCCLPESPRRDPLNTPVLISQDGASIFIKRLRMTRESLHPAQQTFPSEIYAITPGGEVVATAGALYEGATGLKLADVPGSGGVQAITSDYARLVYFDDARRQIRTLDLPATIGMAAMGRTLTPAEGAIVLSPTSLQWSPLAGVSSYRVYLGTSRENVSTAGPGSPEMQGEVAGSTYLLREALATGATYFWRVDPVVAGQVSPGTVHHFSIAALSTDRVRIDAATVRGHADHQVTVSLGAAEPLAWSAAATQPWVRVDPATGLAPGPMVVHLDASALPAGVHTASVILTGEKGVLLTLPVEFRVDPLKITLLRSGRTGSTVYAVSEEKPDSQGRAYLLEIDARTETIQRVVPAGWSVTDLAIHEAEHRLYITNWLSGVLTAYDKFSLQAVRQYAFNPPGTLDRDVFQLSAGGAGRVVVEEMDQWVDVDLIDTATGARLASAPWPTREGGGAFDPSGRYYYHGDNNISNASLRKYDLLGDEFTALAAVRPDEIALYYGSRTLVLSESGNGIFWAGSYFDSSLTEQWMIGKEVFSTTADARYAFAQKEIFDTMLRRQVMHMPAETRISAYNTAAGKLVAAWADEIGFYEITSPLRLPVPVLTSADAVSASSVRLAWVDRSLEMGFEVQSRVEGVEPWLNQAASLGANTRAITVAGLAASTRHEFRVRAVADGVSSDWSAVRSALTPAAPPPAPVPSVIAVQSRRIMISLALEGAVDEILIERQTGRDSAPWVALVRLPGSARGFTDTDVLPENLYNYRFQSSRGGLLSSWASLRNVLTPAVVLPPDAPPFILASSTASTRVAVYWALTTRADGYSVERLGEPGQWLEVGQTGPTVTTFTDTGLHPDTPYIYRVRAFNAGGVSAPSLTALTTTPSQWVEWRLLQFGSPSATGPAASLAVKDDGTTNLVRFAFNLPASGPAPTLASNTDEGLPRIWLHQPSGRLRVEYVRRRPELDPGVSYVVEFGNGAEVFRESGTQISVERVNDSFERVVWEDGQGIDTHPTRLARLRVVEQP